MFLIFGLYRYILFFFFLFILNNFSSFNYVNVFSRLNYPPEKIKILSKFTNIFGIGFGISSGIIYPLPT